MRGKVKCSEREKCGEREVKCSEREVKCGEREVREV